MACNGICVRHKALKPANAAAGRYITGQKRCQICALFLNWESIWCPCCGYRLRTKPRNMKYKAKLKQNIISIFEAGRGGGTNTVKEDSY